LDKTASPCLEVGSRTSATIGRRIRGRLIHQERPCDCRFRVNPHGTDPAPVRNVVQCAFGSTFRTRPTLTGRLRAPAPATAERRSIPGSPNQLQRFARLEPAGASPQDQCAKAAQEVTPEPRLSQNRHTTVTAGTRDIRTPCQPPPMPKR
jgi:hypothetical protein